MKTTVDYSKSPHAVEDIKSYFGDRYDGAAAVMKDVKDCQAFAFYCTFLGIEGLPVRAWYEHFHGHGTWREPVDE